MTFSHHHAHARRDVDMTQGSITRHLIQFALPLLAGNVFQQLYNMVDTWVVGNFVSNEAFSAVGTVGPIINMLIGFFMGLSSGAGVVISQYYGAHRPEKVRDTVHTAMVLTLVLCAVFTALGLALIPAMLDLMNTPAEVLPESTAYLSIYFSGITGLLIYNMSSGILRAVGDSRRPFYFLVVSAVLNTGLDLLFVIRFHMGVAGVAWATIIAQAVSAVLMVPVLVFAPQLTAFFNRKAEVVAYGTLLLRYISPFYLLCCINQIYSGALRGAGNSQVPMVIMLGSFVVFRQIYLYIVSHFITNTLLPLAMGYPAGWLVCSAATLLYYRRAALGRRRLVEDN